MATTNTTESVARAMRATEEEHLAAIASVACPICGAAAGAECAYGLDKAPALRQQFPGRAHTRRVRRHLDR